MPALRLSTAMSPGSSPQVLQPFLPDLTPLHPHRQIPVPIRAFPTFPKNEMNQNLPLHQDFEENLIPGFKVSPSLPRQKDDQQKGMSWLIKAGGESRTAELCL